MNTHSNAIPVNPAEARVVTPAVIPASQSLAWCVRRELWESRSIYLAPMAVAALFLLGFLLGLFRLPHRLRAAALDPAQQYKLMTQPYEFAALLIMFTTFVVTIFYCLDALYGERRDRSILFWKSLPVSDLMTVLSKASIAIVVLPLLTFAVTVVTQWIMLLLSAPAFAANGVNFSSLWTQVSLPQTWVMLLYHLVGVHALWYAPFYGWLLLVSAWARRAPVLWAALPLLAIGMIEKVAFNTTHFAKLLEYRMAGGSEAGPFDAYHLTEHGMEHLNLGQFLGSPGLWIGLALTAAFLAVAVRLRRSQGPI